MSSLPRRIFANGDVAVPYFPIWDLGLGDLNHALAAHPWRDVSRP